MLAYFAFSGSLKALVAVAQSNTTTCEEENASRWQARCSWLARQR